MSVYSRIENPYLPAPTRVMVDFNNRLEGRIQHITHAAGWLYMLDARGHVFRYHHHGLMTATEHALHARLINNEEYQQYQELINLLFQVPNWGTEPFIWDFEETYLMSIDVWIANHCVPHSVQELPPLLFETNTVETIESDPIAVFEYEDDDSWAEQIRVWALDEDNHSYEDEYNFSDV